MERFFYICCLVIIAVGCKDTSKQCKNYSINTLGSIPVDTIWNHYNDFSDFVVHGLMVSALSEDGRVVRWNLTNTDVNPVHLVDNVVAITFDQSGNLWFSKTDRSVNKLDATGVPIKITQVDSVVHMLRFNSRNEGYAITDWGIVSINDGINFFPDTLDNKPFTIDKFWYTPSCAIIDSKDNLWIGFNYGEWGGNIVCFNTITKQFDRIKFDTLRPSLTPIMSLFEGSDKIIYATSGLMHFEVKGVIFAIQDMKCRIIYNRFLTPEFPGDTLSIGEYIGPGAFDESKGTILYYSHLGFFKAIYEKDLFCTQLFYRPELDWSYGQKMAVGYGMNVSKITVLDSSRFVFLTARNGIGFLNTDKLLFFK